MSDNREKEDRLSKDDPQPEYRVRELLALNQAAIAITGELELDSLLQKIVDVAREVAECEYSALGVLGDDGYIVRFPTSGVSELDREKIGAPPRGHGLLGVMLRAGRTLRIPDLNKDPRKIGFPDHHPTMTSLLGVPIFVRGKLMGDLYLTNKIGRAEFTEEDEWLLQLLAVHAATALTNSQLHAENLSALRLASQERARFQALFRVTQAITQSVQIDTVIPVILDSAVELLGATGAAVFLLEESSFDQFGVQNRNEGFGATHYATSLVEIPKAEIQLAITQSVPGWAIRTGQTQVVSDVKQETATIFSRLAGGRELRSMVVVPLLVGQRTLGVLAVYSDRVNAFDHEGVYLVEAFGSQASAALNNAQLYEQAEQGRRTAEVEQERLRELEHMKDEFLSTAAHELRTPLTSIRMSAGLAFEQLQILAARDDLADKIDPRLIDLMRLVLEGSVRMHSLVNNLLDLTRLEQGSAVLTFTRLDMRDVVKESVAATLPLFESKSQTLTVRLPELYCGVSGDSRRLEQAVMNFLSNASKYSPGGAQAEIRVARSGSECLVRVRDTGPGVPEEEREHIFERFYRSTLHRQDRTPGTGLGLPITRQIAEMHGGRVWVESDPTSGGSIFVLSLPLLTD
ncbi:MAG: GAF domain-containing protein [Chloroflexia bacterium]